MNSSRNRNRKNCNGTIDGKACTKSLSCSRRFCSECGKENPLYSTASAISASETDSNSKTGHNTDTSVSDDDEFEDAIDSQNIAQAPLLRLNVNKPKEDNDVFDSSGDNEESDSGINREANPDAQAPAPSERRPLLRLNENNPKEDNDDSSSDDEELFSYYNREANPDDVELSDLGASGGATDVELSDLGASGGATDDCGSNSTQLSSDQIMKNLKQMLITDGPIETKRYIKRMLNQWKNTNVKIAITGSKRVGKSTFINTIRNVKPEDPGYAESGSGDTTLIMTKYVDPRNSRIIYCDCPGVGSLRMTRDQFLEKVDLSSFDYFLIFYKDVLSTDDAWIAEQLTILNKPFCLVRSMLDIDIRNEKHDKPVDKRKNEAEIVKEIRGKAKLSMRTDSRFKGAKLFVISCRKPHLGEMSSCLKHLTDTLPEAKYQAIMFALPVFSKQVIDEKYYELKKRIPFIAMGTAIACAATILPGIGRFTVQNPIIKMEVQRYLKTFCLTEKHMKEIPGVQMNANVPVDYADDIIIRYILSLPPIIGPAIEGGLRVRDILSKTLDSIKLNAHTVHKHCLELDSVGEVETVL